MAKGKQRVKPEYYGETLTRDEVVQRLEENEKQKRENSKAKGGKERRNNQLWRIHDMTNTISRYIMIILWSELTNFSWHLRRVDVNEEICQGCGDHYNEDDELTQYEWIVCDGC